MRRVELVFGVLPLFMLTSCDRMWGPDPRVAAAHKRDVSPHPAPQTPALDRGCTVAEVGIDPCSNLLPDGWDSVGYSAQAVLDAVTEIPLQEAIDRDRAISSDCVKGNASANQKIKVAYNVPKAMLKFPTTGTGTRDLVIGVMTEVAPSNPRCWSARYSVQRELGANKRRLITFLTVRTEAGDHLPGVNRQVGRWRSWTIARQNNSPSAPLELVNTGTGAFVSCGHPHYTTPEKAHITHEFINCDDAERLTTMAVEAVRAGKASAVDQEFERLMGTYARGASIQGVRMSTEIASGWSRCGSLGCCAAE